MTKSQAIDLFGGRVKDLAAALGVTSSAISQWPDAELPTEYADRVRGAAVRLKKWSPVADPQKAAA